MPCPSCAPAAIFDDLVAQIGNAMLIVTTVAGAETAGCLVGFHSQCSIDPPRYSVWLSKANRTFEVAARAEVFALHFLDAGDRDLAERFGTVSGDDENKFSWPDWHAGLDGVPLLDGCPARIVAHRIVSHENGGDHVCFVLAPHETQLPTGFSPLHSTQVLHLDAGHDADEHPRRVEAGRSGDERSS